MNLQEQAKRQDKLTNKYAARLISFVLLGWGTLLFWAHSHFHLSMNELLLTATIPGSFNLLAFFSIYIWLNKGRKEMERRWKQEFALLENRLEAEVQSLKEAQEDEMRRLKEAQEAEKLTRVFQQFLAIPTSSPQKAEELPS